MLMEQEKACQIVYGILNSREGQKNITNLRRKDTLGIGVPTGGGNDSATRRQHLRWRECDFSHFPPHPFDEGDQVDVPAPPRTFINSTVLW